MIGFDNTTHSAGELRLVPFHEDELLTFEHNGAPWVAMRRIVENMGMAWQGQHTKLLSQKAKFSCHDMVTTGADGKRYEMTCVPLAKLPLWLASVNPNKVHDPAVREKVERYQAESAIALHDYWTKGAAFRGPDLSGILVEMAALRQELATLHEEHLAARRIANGAVSTVGYKFAIQVAEDHGVTRKGRGRLVACMGRRLLKFCRERGWPCTREYREDGVAQRHLFAVAAISAWLREEGHAMIAAHLQGRPFKREPDGQGVLKLVGKAP